MTQELMHPALDAAHAVVIAAYDATRFLAELDLGGLVGRLRRTASAANQATLRGCKEVQQAGGRAVPVGVHALERAAELLRELADCVEGARRRGLDLGAAMEVLEYQAHASLTLAALLEHLGAVARAA
jgi:hypothetical protein